MGLARLDDLELARRVRERHQQANSAHRQRRLRAGQVQTSVWLSVELRARLGKEVVAAGTSLSGAIIGRYERGEIAVARKLAEALAVTLDYLVGENALATLQDRAMLERWQTLETLPALDRERILFVLDSLMRDAKTRQAYQASV